jgi:hypothetical protein
MHPYLLESMVEARVADLRGVGNQASAQAAARRPSVRWASAGRARVGRLFVRVGLSLIDDGVGRPARHSARPEPACNVR